MLHVVPNNNHLVTLDSLDDHEVASILDAAAEFAGGRRDSALRGKVVSPLFFQPSTRTRLGFETAALRLGAHVAGFADPRTSRASEATKESFEDTIRTVSAIADVIVVRCGEERAGARAAEASSCPVVNAGDDREHPSQMLTDAFTMRSLLDKPLSEAHVGFTGCISNRSTRHVVKLLGRLGVARMSFLTEPGREPDPITLANAEAAGASVECTGCIDDLLSECDVVSVAPRDTGFTKDPSKPYDDAATLMPPTHVVSAEAIRRTRSKALVMHPLPRRNEISTDVDHLPNAAYFTQVAMSVYVRMAIYDYVSKPSLSYV